MSGLPKLPGLTFSDPTLSRFDLPQTFGIYNGYSIPKSTFRGVGGRELDSRSVRYIASGDTVRYDPSLTYGRTKAPALPQFKPHFALYDKKCLTFKAFFKQSVFESPSEYYRVRHVNIIYFLEDDTITVMEPKVPNSGMDQGRLIKRAKIPKTEAGDYWHWKDLAVGKDIAFYGTVFHTVDCDVFTREYMASQGLEMAEPEQLPTDPYTQNRLMQVQNNFTKTPSADDKFRRFLEYDGKVLRFYALWDDRDSEHGEMRKYEVMYFLFDDTIAVKEIHERNDGRDPYPQLLRKTKLPKIWTDRPVTFPSIYLELSDQEVTEYYQPKDLQVGETIFVLGRKMFLYDCDSFTRNYYKKALCIEQRPPIDIEEKPKPPPKKPVPPHDGIGSLEDSLQNTLTFLPKPPKKDVVKQLLNANKYLRYEMVMEDVHPEDSIRRFLLLYSLGDGTCKIYEPPIRNSGIIGGKYLRSTLVSKPNTDPLNPDYYTPCDFYIGAVITVFEQRFRIVGADLYVYRYMEKNPDKFPCEVIENMRNYMFNKGYLKEDIDKEVKLIDEEVMIAKRDAVAKELEYTKSAMEECLERYGVEKIDEDLTYRNLQKDPIIIPENKVPPYGIQAINTTCAYPIVTGPQKDLGCKTEAEKRAQSEYDTPEERIRKYYDNVLREQKALCEKTQNESQKEDGNAPTTPPADETKVEDNDNNKSPSKKSVTFAEDKNCNKC